MRPPLPPPSKIFAGLSLAETPCVAVGISGGSDSTALLVLLTQYLIGTGVRIVAITVDHGLRSEAAREAHDVGALCGRLGVEHAIKRWVGSKPASGVAAAARAARYALLHEAAAEHDAGLVLIGHTLDDQMETVLMRGRRGAGRGEAGIAPATRFDGTWFVRPLLDHTRSDLRAYLREQRIGWIEDPSNANMTAERVRIRRELSDHAELRAQLRVRNDEASERRTLDVAQAAKAVGQSMRLVAPGLVRVDTPLLADPTPGGHYAFRALLAIMGGREHLPDESRTVRMMDALKTPGYRGVLSRALADRRKDAAFVVRETRNVPPEPGLLGPGAMPWDGRFVVGEKAEAPEYVGFDHGTGDVPGSLIRAGRATEPFAQGEISGARGPLMRRVLSPWHTLLPSFDWPLANAFARLFGLPETQPPPFSGHIGPKA